MVFFFSASLQIELTPGVGPAFFLVIPKGGFTLVDGPSPSKQAWA